MKNAVVFGFTGNHAGAVALVVMDLVRLSGKAISEIVFLHDQRLKAADCKILRSLAPSRFIRYEPSRLFALQPTAKAVRQFTPMVFSKYECLRLLDDYDTVTWLDYDIVVLKDISELFAPASSGWKLVPGGLSVRQQFRQEFVADIAGYDLLREGVCSSAFTVDRNLKRAVDILEFCYRTTEKYQKVLYMPEQGVFDLALQEFSIEPTWLEHAVYTPHPTSYPDHAKIIHAYGSPKFWNGLYNEHWESNYRKWLALGGTPITKTRRRRNVVGELLRRVF